MMIHGVNYGVMEVSTKADALMLDYNSLVLVLVVPSINYFDTREEQTESHEGRHDERTSWMELMNLSSLGSVCMPLTNRRWQQQQLPMLKW